MILAVMFWGCATVRLLTGAYSPIGGGEQTKELKQKMLEMHSNDMKDAAVLHS